jgi:DNA transformation protein
VPMSYWSVPEAALDSAEAMQPWARLALEAAARAATAKPARGRTRKRGRI